RSVPRLLFVSFSRSGVAHLRDSLRMPAATALAELPRAPRLPIYILIINTLGVAAWTVAVVAALYAGTIQPALRVTAVSLSAFISGGATILLYVFSDPYLAGLTDDVLEGRATEPFFRRSVIWLVGSRLVGTLGAQLLLVPAASAIALLARRL
ncbi:MAG TPA: DUF2837 family protein, partial [Gemmatimonadaceae bacterium]|nr:DUF2837 family protein [Gemmatimonadaceae bacterium]